jgi:hypothetical protein
MTITFGAICIPIILTLVCLGFMFRPSKFMDFTALLSILWLIPIGFIWAAYFAFGWWSAL